MNIFISTDFITPTLVYLATYILVRKILNQSTTPHFTSCISSRLFDRTSWWYTAEAGTNPLVTTLKWHTADAGANPLVTTLVWYTAEAGTNLLITTPEW